MKLLKYKGITFDDWTEDEYGIHAQICKQCLDKFSSVLDFELDSSGGVGACSVEGCCNVGADDDIEMTYVDFDTNAVEIA